MEKDKIVELVTAIDTVDTKNTRIKALEDKVTKLEAAPVGRVPAGNVEVGDPDRYKGFMFRRQGVDSPQYFPTDAKLKSRIVKEVLDLFAPMASRKSDIYKAAMQEGSAGEGLEYVPEQWASNVEEKARLVSVGLRECRRFPVAGNVLHIPKQGTSVTVTWANEESASSESEPGTATLPLTLKRLGLWGVISQELLDDAMNDIVSYITRDVVEAIGQEVDDQVFNGNQFTGLFDAISTHVVTLSGGIGTISAAKIYEAIYKLHAIHRRGAKFYLPKEIQPYIQTLTTGTSGQPLVSYLYGTPAQALAGYPVEEVAAISGTDSTATGYCCFGNLQNYALAIRMMPTGIEMNPWDGTSFKQNQVLFRYYCRLAGSPIFESMFSQIKSH